MSLTRTKVLPDISPYVVTVADMANVRAFPVIADNGTAAPFAVYRKTTQTTEPTKDGAEYSANYEIKFAAQSYAECIEIAARYVAQVFTGEDEDTNFAGFLVSDVDVTDYGVDWAEGYYIASIGLNINYIIK